MVHSSSLSLPSLQTSAQARAFSRRLQGKVKARAEDACPMTPTALIALAFLFQSQGSSALPAKPIGQPIDVAYTAKIKEYTTEPFFLTELVDHLPASDTV